PCPIPTVNVRARHDALRLTSTRWPSYHLGDQLEWGLEMLVLSRKKNESIIINDHIVVTVVEIRRGKVRLCIEAPKDVAGHRREVYDAIQNQQHQAQPRDSVYPDV